MLADLQSYVFAIQPMSHTNTQFKHSRGMGFDLELEIGYFTPYLQDLRCQFKRRVGFNEESGSHLQLTCPKLLGSCGHMFLLGVQLHIKATILC
jgi:hypothetical protein